MPYIKQEDRKQFHYLLLPHNAGPSTPGEFNYCVSAFADRYLNTYGVTYRSINELVGALECVKLELYRRVAVQYENQKCADNGDVYTETGEPKCL